MAEAGSNPAQGPAPIPAPLTSCEVLVEAIRYTIKDLAARMSLPMDHPDKQGILQDLMQAMECYGAETIIRGLCEELNIPTLENPR
jgi:hypothetical protein